MLQGHKHGRLVVQYDPATDSWAAIAEMSTARREHTAVAVGGSIYIIGGQNGAALASCEVYAVDSNSWGSVADMPPRSGHAAAALGTNIYVVGGWAPAGWDSGTATALVYDTAADSWSSLASMGASRNWRPGAAFVGSSLVVVGGRIGRFEGTDLDSAEAYDATTNTWATAAPMRAARHSTAAVALVWYMQNQRLTYPPGARRSLYLRCTSSSAASSWRWPAAPHPPVLEICHDGPGAPPEKISLPPFWVGGSALSHPPCRDLVDPWIVRTVVPRYLGYLGTKTNGSRMAAQPPSDESRRERHGPRSGAGWCD
jgi:hypothetical protein